jgi:hypothetical protein
MTYRIGSLLLIAGVAAAMLALSAKMVARASSCTDIPVRATLYTNAVVDPATGATVPSALLSDGGGEYSASIKTCSGTNDAVVNVTSTKRTFTYVFPGPISGSVIQAVPTWVPGTVSASGWINVRNITYNHPSQMAFTTHMGSTFSAGSKATYRLGFDPFQVDAPDLHSGDTNASIDNTPYGTSPAVVYPTYPAVCGPGSMPTWLVRGTTTVTINGQPITEVATLHLMPTNPNGSQTHEGQYSLPFEMLIEATQCFTY